MYIISNLLFPVVFQKHYMDCSFSMTGHQVIIVTAGAGIFEVSTPLHTPTPTSLTPHTLTQVDHELTRLTNERIISGGVATDLVCLTDQPLHAVPLLKVNFDPLYIYTVHVRFSIFNVFFSFKMGRIIRTTTTFHTGSTTHSTAPPILGTGSDFSHASNYRITWSTPTSAAANEGTRGASCTTPSLVSGWVRSIYTYVFWNIVEILNLSYSYQKF